MMVGHVRALGFESEGAEGHIRTFGDRGKSIVRDFTVRMRVLETLGEVSCKLGRHASGPGPLGPTFRLRCKALGENLIAGMRGFLASYTIRFKRTHQWVG